MKTVVTVTGIRPDFIRMSKIFKKLDENFNHILIHTGQHYDKYLSDVFFNELHIRKPDFNLEVGADAATHYEQAANLNIRLIEVLKQIGKIDCVIYLGDSNSVASSINVKKEGYKIGHIEAGMRSYDKRMFEEINRTVCDHCSDFLFVYHDNYKLKLSKENIKKNVYVVGNTIVEPLRDVISNDKKELSHIILDIHRPENFKYKQRLINILDFANQCGAYEDITVNFLEFKRTLNYINEFNIDLSRYSNIKVSPLMSYKEFINAQYHSKFIISDSGTAQEEAALLNTPVIVPRDFTERPESIESGCSLMVDANKKINIGLAMDYIRQYNPDTSWLGEGNTSDLIVNKLLKLL